MPKHYNIHTNEILDLPAETIAAWEAAGNPKLADYAPLPPQPTPEAVWQSGQWITPPPPATTAEEHLVAQGYTPLRLLTLLDIEGKLRAANATSPALTAVRSWLDQLTLAAALDPNATRPDWPAAPAPFEAVLSEALAALQ